MRMTVVFGVVGWLLVGVASIGSPAPITLTLAESEQFFPDPVGSRWRYRGEVTEGPLQSIARKTYENVSWVKGTDTINGVSVTVFHDTNPANHGQPSDSFYRRDAAGIVYYGSEPGTTLERQLVPYQIVRFPILIPSSFQQFDRKGIDFGNDLDGDDENEKADLEATVTVLPPEAVSVPAGTYDGAVRIEARMKMRIYLSGSRRVLTGTDTLTAWFAKSVGLVKYFERQELPSPSSDRGFVSEITEELEEVEIKKPALSFRRSESSPERVLAHDARGHELWKVVTAARLCAHP